MFKRLAAISIALVISCGVAFGEHFSLQDIQRTIPYATVQRAVPGLTHLEYLTAATRIARMLNGEMSVEDLTATNAFEPRVPAATFVITDALLVAAGYQQQSGVQPAIPLPPSTTTRSQNAIQRPSTSQTIGNFIQAAAWGASAAQGGNLRNPGVTVPTIGPLLGTTTQIGDTTFTCWSNGDSSTANRIGNTTFLNTTCGLSATQNQIGQFGFTDFSNGTSATSSQIDSFGFTNYSNGLTSTTTRIGNITFTNFSDGSSATSTNIGGFSFTNFLPSLTLPALPPIVLPGVKPLP